MYYCLVVYLCFLEKKYYWIQWISNSSLVFKDLVPDKIVQIIKNSNQLKKERTVLYSSFIINQVSRRKASVHIKKHTECIFVLINNISESERKYIKQKLIKSDLRTLFLINLSCFNKILCERFIVQLLKLSEMLY